MNAYRISRNGESIVAKLDAQGRVDHPELAPVELDTFRGLGWTVEELEDGAELEVAPRMDPLDIVVTVPRTGARANLSSIARVYISETKRSGGYVKLSCECGKGEVVIDRLASETDEAELVDLIQHSLFDHVMPYRLEVTKVEDALDLLSIPAAEDGSVLIGLGR